MGKDLQIRVTEYQYVTLPNGQCCGSASLWCGSGSESGFDVPVPPWCESGFFFLSDADANPYPDPTFHPDGVTNVDPYRSFQIKAPTQPLKKCSNRLIFHTFWLVICKLCGSSSGSSLSLWCGSGSWFLFDADPDFYVVRMRIQVIKMMRIHNTAHGTGCTVGNIRNGGGWNILARQKIQKIWKENLCL